MFTQVSFGQFLEPLFKQAHSRYGIEFSDQYPNLAVYTPQAVGLWGYEVVGGFSLRLFRWLTKIPEQVIRGPYEIPMSLQRNSGFALSVSSGQRSRPSKTSRCC
jgi:hypothetical protein